MNGTRTLRVAASGTLLVLAVFSAFVVTVGASTRSLGAGIAGQAWSLSGMSLGLAPIAAAGVALVVTVGSASGAGGPVEGFDRAALLSAVLCALGALIVLASTKGRRK